MTILLITQIIIDIIFLIAIGFLIIDKLKTKKEIALISKRILKLQMGISEMYTDIKKFLKKYESPQGQK